MKALVFGGSGSIGSAIVELHLYTFFLRMKYQIDNIEVLLHIPLLINDLQSHYQYYQNHQILMPSYEVVLQYYQSDISSLEKKYKGEAVEFIQMDLTHDIL
jgi:hypothetical protein